MLRLACVAVCAVLVQGVQLRAAGSAHPSSASGTSALEKKPFPQEALSARAAVPDGSVPAPSAAPKPATMQEESRLAILRNVDGEFARMVTSLPGTKKGFRIKAGQPLDQNALRQAIRSYGASLNPGDGVQITRLGFLANGISIDLNGGGTIHRSWKDHLQVQMTVNSGSPVQTSSSASDERARIAAAKKPGATFILEFGSPLPDMTPEQVKQYLGVVLDFSKQRSAAVQWVNTLPPEVQQAIEDKRAIAGMDHEQVLVAMGRPDRKVRERDEQGNEIENWIYGQPPSPTVFVRFFGDKVTQITQYP